MKATEDLLLRLSDADDLQRVGGKAHALAQMMRLGMHVPDGFVVGSEALDAFIHHNQLAQPIAAALELIDVDQPTSLATAATSIHDLVLHGDLPPQLRGQLDRARSELDGPLIVRSSAIGEDGAGASFAGQLDSILGVQSQLELEHALRCSWASRWSARSLSYQARKGIALEKMAVIVQCLVDASLSGVLFTTSPTDGESDVMIGEYCHGTGEALMSGHINPGRFVIEREDLAWRLESRFRPPDNDDAVAHDEQEPLLSSEVMEQLAGAALALEKHFGCPQDIEWTVDRRGELLFVQSRAITTKPATDVLWSNANVNENFPGPISPLLYSIASTGYYHYFRNLALALGISKQRVASMEHGLRYIIGVHGGRMYYNLSHIHDAIRLAPFGEVFTQYFNDFVGVRVTAPPLASAAPLPGLRRLMEVVVIVFKTAWQYLFLRRRIRAFERTIDAFSDRWHPSAVESMSAPELLAGLREFMRIRSNWTSASLADTGATVCYGSLKSLLRRGLPNDNQEALHNTLLKGLPDVVSAEPVIGLWRLSRIIRDDAALRELFTSERRATLAKQGGSVLAAIEQSGRFHEFRAALADYLETWGFRCSGELMLRQPCFQEDPSGLIDILATYAAQDSPSPVDGHATAKPGAFA